MIDKESGKLTLDLEDELVSATLLTHDGKAVHPNFASAAPTKKKAPAKKTSTKPSGAAK